MLPHEMYVQACPAETSLKCNQATVSLYSMSWPAPTANNRVCRQETRIRFQHVESLTTNHHIQLQLFSAGNYSGGAKQISKEQWKNDDMFRNKWQINNSCVTVNRGAQCSCQLCHKILFENFSDCLFFYYAAILWLKKKKKKREQQFFLGIGNLVISVSIQRMNVDTSATWSGVEWQLSSRTPWKCCAVISEYFFMWAHR